MKRRVSIAISMGDPCGVGPEVLAKVLKRLACVKGVCFLVAGDSRVFSRYIKKFPANTTLIDLRNASSSHFRPGSPNRASAKASLDYLNCAVSLIKDKRADALVTAPISKDAVLSAGFSWPGHTEFLAHSFSARHVEMVFVSERLRVILVTRHLSLKKAIRLIRKPRIVACGQLACGLLKKYFKIKCPRIAVCGLNPHAGEAGLFGNEELVQIAPAVKILNKMKGSRFCGPFAADTLFYKAYKGQFDMVMAMFHDQGLIPFKMLEFEHGVNLTAGLPFVRTSPVHGTAYDIAGKNVADFRSMAHAIMLAQKLTKNNLR